MLAQVANKYNVVCYNYAKLEVTMDCLLIIQSLWINIFPLLGIIWNAHTNSFQDSILEHYFSCVC